MRQSILEIGRLDRKTLLESLGLDCEPVGIGHHMPERPDMPREQQDGEGPHSYSRVNSALRLNRPGLCVRLYRSQIARASSYVQPRAMVVCRPASGSRPFGHAGFTRHHVRVKQRYVSAVPLIMLCPPLVFRLFKSHACLPFPVNPCPQRLRGLRES